MPKLKPISNTLLSKLDRASNKVAKALRRARRAAHTIALDPKGRVLALRNRAGEWTLPGGQVDKGESDHAAMRRETHEETGLSVQSVGHSMTTLPYAGGAKIGRVFLSLVDRARAKIRLTHEHVAARWMQAKEAVRRLVPRHAEAVAILV